MNWPHRYYRMLFLGPISHLYVVVERMKNHLHEARSVVKKMLNAVAQLEIENMQSSLTRMKLAMALLLVFTMRTPVLTHCLQPVIQRRDEVASSTKAYL